jgi:hypothetical protein
MLDTKRVLTIFQRREEKQEVDDDDCSNPIEVSAITTASFTFIRISKDTNLRVLP